VHVHVVSPSHSSARGKVSQSIMIIVSVSKRPGNETQGDMGVDYLKYACIMRFRSLSACLIHLPRPHGGESLSSLGSHDLPLFDSLAVRATLCMDKQQGNGALGYDDCVTWRALVLVVLRGACTESVSLA
jgi:hypothetical protein